MGHGFHGGHGWWACGNRREPSARPRRCGGVRVVPPAASAAPRTGLTIARDAWLPGLGLSNLDGCQADAVAACGWPPADVEQVGVASQGDEFGAVAGAADDKQFTDHAGCGLVGDVHARGDLAGGEASCEQDEEFLLSRGQVSATAAEPPRLISSRTWCTRGETVVAVAS